MITPLYVSQVMSVRYPKGFGFPPENTHLKLEPGAYLSVFGASQFELLKWWKDNLPTNYTILFDDRVYNAVHDEIPNRLNVVIFEVE